MTEIPSEAATGRDPTGAPAGDGGERSLAGRRHRLQTAQEWVRSGGSALFFGAVGVGKSAAVDVIMAGTRQMRTLRYAPAPADANRPVSTLAGLLSTVTEAELDPVPSPRRRVLEAAMAGDTGSITSAALRLATLNLIRVLARAGTLLLVVDDLQWVDEVSAETLNFVASRVEDLPVQMAAAELVPGEELPKRRGLCPPPLLVVRLEAITATGLSAGAPWHGSGLRAGTCWHKSDEWIE